VKDTALFGGTFNPIHIGHLIIAEEVCNKLGLKNIVFVPCFIPPHKSTYSLASAEDRLKMVKLAIRNNAKLSTSSLEIKRKGRSYTVDTVKSFHKKLSNKRKLMFIIGTDSLKELKEWKDIKEISRIVKFVVVNRPGFKLNRVPGNYIPLSIPDSGISSSSIRRKLAKGTSVRYQIPEQVLKYIKKKGLYKKK